MKDDNEDCDDGKEFVPIIHKGIIPKHKDIIPKPIHKQKVTLVLDTETTGLSSHSGPMPYYDLVSYDNARMIQLAYEILDEDGLIILTKDNLVKPIGFTVKCTEIHGITQETADEKGRSILDVLIELNNDITKFDVKMITSYNLNFDMNVILSEMYRIKFNMSIFSCHIGYCLMEAMRPVCRLPKNNPSLMEAYKYCYPYESTYVEHKCSDDVYAARKIYQWIIEHY